MMEKKAYLYTIINQSCMKLLVIGDLHGQIPKIHFKEVDAIIAPGDFCSDAPKSYMFQSLKEKLAGSKTARDWYDITGKQKAKEMVKKSLADGRLVLEHLNSAGKPVYVVPGNWDWKDKAKDRDFSWPFFRKDFFAELIAELDNITSVHLAKADFGRYSIIGYGLSSAPEYPQTEQALRAYKGELVKMRTKYNTLLKQLSALFRGTRKPVIFLSHNVPYNTPLDIIVNKDSPKHGVHSGSLVTRTIIERFQPLLCIGGHMHEHFGSCKLGKTLCINSGFGAEVNTLVELEGNKIKCLDFRKGLYVKSISRQINEYS